jgi:hypothetical protein
MQMSRSSGTFSTHVRAHTKVVAPSGAGDGKKYEAIKQWPSYVLLNFILKLLMRAYVYMIIRFIRYPSWYVY